MITEIISENITEIQERYFSVQNPTIEGANYSRTRVFPERNFVVQVRDLIQRHYHETNLNIDMEFYKQISGRIHQYPLLNKHYDNYNFRNGIFPDLIIHADQDDTNPANQVFSMECKTSPRLSPEDFEKDLFKLMLYKEVLNYSENLFLIINNEPDNIRALLQQYQDAGKYYSPNDIHILNIPRFGVDPVLIL